MNIGQRCKVKINDKSSYIGTIASKEIIVNNKHVVSVVADNAGWLTDLVSIEDIEILEDISYDTKS